MVGISLFLFALNVFATDIIPPPPIATWKSDVANVASLPATGNTPGDSRIALDTFDLYVWTGSAWQNSSSGGVVSFNGRTGAITSQLSDYSSYFLQLGGGTLTGPLVLSGPGTSGNQAITYTQLQDAINGLAWKQDIISATTSPIGSYTYNNGTAGVGSTITMTATGPCPSIDTVAPTLGGRYGIFGETGGNAPYNGIYVISTLGATGVHCVYTRPTDIDTATQMAAATVNTDEGQAPPTGNLNVVFTQTANNITMGTTPLVWTNIFNTLQGGNGIQTSSGVINALYDNSTIGLNGSNQLYVLNSAISDAQVSSTAAIQGTKISPNFGSQNVQTTGTGTFKNLTVNGTAGSGFLNLQTQSAMSTAPSNGFNIFADASGSAIQFQPTSGYRSAFTFSATGNRVYTFPDTTDNVVMQGYPQTLTQKTLGNLTVIGDGNTAHRPTMNLTGADATGDMYYRDSTGKLLNLGLGSANQVLTSNGTIPAWGNSVLPTSTQTQIFDDFLGVNFIGWTGGGTGTGAGATILTAPPTVTAGAPGIAQLNTGTTATGFAQIGQVGNAFSALGNGTAQTYETRVMFPALSSSTQRYLFFAGLSETNGAYGADALNLVYSDNVNSGDWECMSGNGGTVVTTAIPVVANTWYKLGISVNSAASSVGYYINGTLACTITTHIPVGTANPGSWRTQLVKSVGTTASLAYLDYMSLTAFFSTPR